MRFNYMTAIGDQEVLRALACCRIEYLNDSGGLVGRIGAVATTEDKVFLSNNDIDRARKLRRRCEDRAKSKQLAKGIGLSCVKLLLED